MARVLRDSWRKDRTQAKAAKRTRLGNTRTIFTARLKAHRDLRLALILGHVAVSGRFRSLIAKGSPAELQKVATAINQVGVLSDPLNLGKLKRAIAKLERLGFTMKTWGRLLALVRPDLYCTVSADSVRENLSGVLGIPQSHFQRPEGYIRLLQLVHRSPWFNSNRPSDPVEAAVWDRRGALIDPIYYRGRNPT